MRAACAADSCRRLLVSGAGRAARAAACQPLACQAARGGLVRARGPLQCPPQPRSRLPAAARRPPPPAGDAVTDLAAWESVRSLYWQTKDYICCTLKSNMCERRGLLGWLGRRLVTTGVAPQAAAVRGAWQVACCRYRAPSGPLPPA